MAPPNARRNTAIAASLCYLISLPILILVLVGNTSVKNVLNSFYFFKLDVSHIIPIAVNNSQLLNSVARSLGLHDFYTVGLWNFCEGYLDEGVTYCSSPRKFYWFNPVDVLVSELLAGARIALPAQVATVLRLLRIGSHVMFACFLAGTILNLFLLALSPFALRRRLISWSLACLGLLSALVLIIASAIATVISLAAKIALTAQDQLDIHAQIGVKMFACMWIASSWPLFYTLPWAAAVGPSVSLDSTQTVIAPAPAWPRRAASPRWRHHLFPPFCLTITRHTRDLKANHEKVGHV